MICYNNPGSLATNRGTPRFRRTVLAVSVALLLLVLSRGPHAEDGSWAVASTKPIHSLLAGVMAGVGSPGLLLRGRVSPHDYAMRPSDAALLEDARILFWTGPALERFLERPLAALDDSTVAVALLPGEGLTALALRPTGIWEPGSSRPVAAGEPDAALDPHFWLDPKDAVVVVGRMARELARLDPDHAKRYAENAADLEGRLGALDAELAALYAPVANRPFLVFHDAYQYLEARYGLAGAGALTLEPDQPIGAATLGAIRGWLAEHPGACVFREPQAPDEAVAALVADTGARIAELDAEALDLEPGPELYFDLMRKLATAMTACLAG